MTRILKLSAASAVIAAFALPAFAGDFGTLDTNLDGQIDFKEYRTYAAAQGTSSTLAAQAFTKMSQGDAFVSQDEFLMADLLKDQPYALQPVLKSEPAPAAEWSAPVTVETAPIAEPMAEYEVVIEPPVIEETETTDPESLTIERPETGVASEVETYAPEMDATPVEEGLSDLPEALELDTPSMDDEAIETDGLDMIDIAPITEPEVETDDVSEPEKDE